MCKRMGVARGLPGGSVKSLPTVWETWVRSLDCEDTWRKKWQPTPVFLPGESHGQRSLVGGSPWGHEEPDTPEWLSAACVPVKLRKAGPVFWFFAWWLSWQRICLQCRRPWFNSWLGNIPWKRERLPTPVFWPGEFHGLYSPWGLKESDTTEWLSLQFNWKNVF